MFGEPQPKPGMAKNESSGVRRDDNGVLRLAPPLDAYYEGSPEWEAPARPGGEGGERSAGQPVQDPGRHSSSTAEEVREEGKRLILSAVPGETLTVLHVPW